MPAKYIVASLPLRPDISALEAASVVTRALRTKDRSLRSEHIVQLPLLDGGEGSLEHLVTLTLGSFLEVEVTDGQGSPAIVPLGLLGEEGKTAFINTMAVAQLQDRPTEDGTRKRSRKQIAVPSTGTTYGIGELMRDALDEGAFSIVLGWNEPLVRDAGLGLAAALGVKFFDKDGKELDLSKPNRDLFASIDRIDASARPFELLSARVFLARTEGVKRAGQEEQYSVENTIFETELGRIAEIMKRDCGVTIDASKVLTSASALEFGLGAFCNLQIRDGAQLLLEAVNIDALLSEPKIRMLVVAERLEDVYGSRAGSAAQDVLMKVKQHELPVSVILGSQPSPQLLGRFRRSIPSLTEVTLLSESKLFLPPLGSSSSLSELRQDVLLRMQDIVPRISISTLDRQSA